MADMYRLIYKAHREHVQRMNLLDYTCGFCGNKQRDGSSYVCKFCGTTNSGMPYKRRKGYNKIVKEL